ncbi:MAG: fibro-slime domain-containing protein [Phycisphaeraceae bacterium]|nr:fibro-slime domain-containing protein [Phycisphaeraceae bacterium]
MKRNLLLSALAAGVFAATGYADQIELEGVIRDFKNTHYDMQASFGDIALVQNLVMPQLDADNKPVLNTAVNFQKGKIHSAQTFQQWYRDTPGVNIAIPFTLTLDNHQDQPGGVYSVAWDRDVKVDGKPQYFFPIDGQGWGDRGMAADGRYHNFYFTFELHTQFTYSDPATRNFALTFSFLGDDDVWVFVNKQLVVDIGGVHAQKSGAVNLDDKAAQLGLVPGNTYQLDFFSAERYLSESNLRMETTLELQPIPPTTTNPLYD